MCTKPFLKAVLQGTKTLIKLDKVRFVQVPIYDELSVKNLYSKFLELYETSNYFPDHYASGRQCNRDYFFNITNTLHSAMLWQIIEHALKQRHASTEEELKKESVGLSEYMKDELDAMDHFSKVSIYLLF